MMISFLAYLVREVLDAEPVLALHVASAWSVQADVSTSSELTTGGTPDGSSCTTTDWSTGMTTDGPAYKSYIRACYHLHCKYIDKIIMIFHKMRFFQ